MKNHPFCCDEFASWADDGDSEGFQRNADGSWTALFDYNFYKFGPIRFCPFCGSRVDGKKPMQPAETDAPHTAGLDGGGEA